MREWLNKNPMIVTGAAIALLVAALGVIVLTTGLMGEPLPEAGETYYMDVETGEWFVGRDAAEPPTSPAGNASVSAVMYSCGGCDNEEALFIGYVRRTIPPEERPAGMPEREADVVAQDAERWVPRNSSQGQTIMAPPPCEDGSPAQRCRVSH